MCMMLPKQPNLIEPYCGIPIISTYGTYIGSNFPVEKHKNGKLYVQLCSLQSDCYVIAALGILQVGSASGWERVMLYVLCSGGRE